MEFLTKSWASFFPETPILSPCFLNVIFFSISIYLIYARKHLSVNSGQGQKWALAGHMEEVLKFLADFAVKAREKISGFQPDFQRHLGEKFFRISCRIGAVPLLLQQSLP